MKKVYSNEGMLGVAQNSKPIDILNVVDKQLKNYGLEIMYFPNNNEMLWKIDKSDSKVKRSESGGIIHKSGATIRRVM